jgi:hypothetical protein
MAFALTRGVMSFLVVTCLAHTLPAAITYDIDLDPDNSLYGHLDQNDVLAGGVGGQNSCAPTATMNSFIYLQNRFSSVYGTNDELMGPHDEWVDAAIDLADNFMKTDPVKGTKDANWINGKYDWLETYAPGKTTYAGFDEFTTGNQPWVTMGIPPLMFLIQQLLKGANNELGISPAIAGIGHVLTLTSLHWTDEDMDGIFDDDTEDLSIDGIDPGGGALFEYSLKTIMSDDKSYLGFDGGPYDGYRIDAALAEVAIPEPASVFIWTLLATTLAVTALRRGGRDRVLRTR